MSDERQISRRKTLLLSAISASALARRAAAETDQACTMPPAAATLTNAVATANDSPQVQVSGVRRAFWNGEHNAFTDLCWFNERIYLTFRSCPDGHMVHPTSCTIILCSEDQGVSWQEVHRFSVPLRDTRDPHFLVFRKRLFVYTGTWYSGKPLCLVLTTT